MALVVLAGAAALTGASVACSCESGQAGTGADARVRVVVTIAPYVQLVQWIGGPEVAVTPLVPAGASPERYAPRASDLQAVARADIYVSTGWLPFDQIHVGTLRESNPQLRVVDLSAVVDRRVFLPMGLPDRAAAHPVLEHLGADPHHWLSPWAVRAQLPLIATALAATDPGRRGTYAANLVRAQARVDELIARIDALAGASGLFDPNRDGSASQGARPRPIVVVQHPSFGYLTDRLHLRQIAVEVEGKEASGAGLSDLARLAAARRVQTIITQRGQPAAQLGSLIAEIERLHRVAAGDGTAAITLRALDPLAPNWEANVLQITEVLLAAARASGEATGEREVSPSPRGGGGRP